MKAPQARKEIDELHFNREARQVPGGLGTGTVCPIGSSFIGVPTNVSHPSSLRRALRFESHPTAVFGVNITLSFILGPDLWSPHQGDEFLLWAAQTLIKAAGIGLGRRFFQSLSLGAPGIRECANRGTDKLFAAYADTGAPEALRRHDRLALR